MVQNKKISIIIPVHNTQPNYIKTALVSLLNQTYRNLEIIVIDDGSTDESTIAYLSSIENPKVKLVRQKCSGPGHARNTGLQISDGDYIGFLDSDDWVDSNFYEVLLRLCESSDADIACALLIRKDGKFEKSMNRLDNIVTDDLMKKISYIKNGSACDKLFKNKLLRNIKFDEGVLFEDNVFLIKCLLRSKKVAFTNTTKYYYRVNEKSNVLNKELSLKRHVDKIEVLQRIYDVVKILKKDEKKALLNIFVPILVEEYSLITNSEYRKKIEKILGLDYLSYCNLKISSKIINSSFYKFFYIFKCFISKIMNFIFSIHNSKDKRYKLIKFFGFEFKLIKNEYINI